MAKKKEKVMKKKAKKKQSHKDMHHLTACLRLTIRNIKNDGTDLDAFFLAQAERLKKQINEIS
jgi:hypothetical protein